MRSSTTCKAVSTREQENTVHESGRTSPRAIGVVRTWSEGQVVCNKESKEKHDGGIGSDHGEKEMS